MTEEPPNPSERVLNSIECIVCNICKKFSYTREDYDIHMDIHSKNLDCDVCKKPFSNIKCRARHYKEAHKDVMLNCDPCNITYKRVSEMSLHRKFHTRECPYLCMLCLRCFSSLSGLRDHQRQHDRNVRKAIAANKMSREFPNDDSDKKDETNPSSEEFMCDVCGKTFALQRKLATHKLTHTTPDIYRCNCCDKKFKNRKLLIDHLKYLGSEPNVEYKSSKKVRPLCHTCGKSFCDSRHLRRHREFHLPTGVFPCKLCDKVFDLNIKLKLHMMWHRRKAKSITEQTTLDKFKSFPCEFCGKVFLFATSLYAHRRLHTGSFACSLCGKIFNKRWNLKTHMTVHLGDKPYSCSYCGASYADRSNLKKHLTKHPQELEACILVNRKPQMDGY